MYYSKLQWRSLEAEIRFFQFVFFHRLQQSKEIREDTEYLRTATRDYLNFQSNGLLIIKLALFSMF